jgi:hypothetical protein
LSDQGLSAICATTAPVGSFPLLAVLVFVADEYPALKTRAGTLQASVVGLYGVVIVVVGVYPRCVHSLHPFCGPGSGVLPHLRGHFSLSGDYIILQ